MSMTNGFYVPLKRCPTTIRLVARVRSVAILPTTTLCTGCRETTVTSSSHGENFHRHYHYYRHQEDDDDGMMMTETIDEGTLLPQEPPKSMLVSIPNSCSVGPLPARAQHLWEHKHAFYTLNQILDEIFGILPLQSIHETRHSTKTTMTNTTTTTTKPTETTTETIHNTRPLLRQIDERPVVTTTHDDTLMYGHFFSALFARRHQQQQQLDMTNPSMSWLTPPDDDDRNNASINDMDISRNKIISSRSGTMMKTFRLDIRYRGNAFCGWQRQGPYTKLPSIQQVVEDWFQSQQQLYRPHPENILTQPPSPPPPAQLKRVNVRVCGRTDAGVHAFRQICRFRIRPKDYCNYFYENNHHDIDHDHEFANRIQHEFNNPTSSSVLSSLSSSLQCIHVTPVSSKFHPTFGATCRAYAYLIDWHDDDIDDNDNNDKNDDGSHRLVSAVSEKCRSHIITQRLNELLQPLIGQELDYYSMSYGPMKTQNTLCTILYARVDRVTTTTTEDAPEHVALMFQLVANRFLRRMVRLLVATCLELALDDSLWINHTHDTTTNHNDKDCDGNDIITVPTTLSSSSLENGIVPLSLSHDLSSSSSSSLSSSLWKSLLQQQLLLPGRFSLIHILQQQDRRASASKPAPAHGLMLMGADFVS